MSAPDPAQTATESLAETVSVTLRLAGGLVEGGRQVDLTGLDGMIGQLCARALDLPAEQRPAMRARLAELLAQLDGLSVTLASG